MPAEFRAKRSPYQVLRGIRLHPGKLEVLRLAKGWTVDQLMVETGAHNGQVPMDKRTVANLLRGGEAAVASATVLAKTLGAANLLAVVADDLLPEVGPPHTWGRFAELFPSVGEWEVFDVLAGQITTPNGLVYDVCRMRSRASAERLGRGKCYDLGALADRDKRALRESLLRHATVCDRLAKSAYFPQNYCVTPDESQNTFWVVDRWVEGHSLADVMAAKPIAAQTARQVALQLLNALVELHAASVIRRELSPHSILLQETTQQATLTDLELAKLTDGRPTVAASVQWPADPYLAPEIRARTGVDPRADLYSWARIVVQLCLHRLPAPGQETADLEASSLPKAVRTALAACLAIEPQRRPETAAHVVAALRRW